MRAQGIIYYLGPRSDKSNHHHEGWQNSDAAFCQNLLTTCYNYYYRSENPTETRYVSVTSSLRRASRCHQRYRCSCCISSSCRLRSTNAPYMIGSGWRCCECPTKTTSTSSSVSSAANLSTAFPNNKQINVRRQYTVASTWTLTHSHSHSNFTSVQFPKSPRSLLCHIASTAWTGSSELLDFYFIFPYLFVSGPCARLSWPSRQLLSAR